MDWNGDVHSRFKLQRLDSSIQFKLKEINKAIKIVRKGTAGRVLIDMR